MEIKIEGFKPYPKQREWINKIEDPTIKYITLCSGRQIGKTLLAQNLFLKWAIENNNSNLMFVFPVYSQARKVYSEIEKVLGGTPLLVSSNKSNYEMGLVNGSKMIFRSAENGDSLRGYTLDFLIIDEAAYIRDDVWNTILKPTILVRGRKVLFISTPRGKNWFYGQHLRGLDQDQTQYLTLAGSSFDNPYIEHDELNEAKKTLPEDVFRQEILGEFVDSGGEVFQDIDRYCILPSFQPPQSNKKYYAGIDVGRQNDYSVLSIFDQEGNLVYLYRERQKSWGEIVGYLAQKLGEYKAVCQIEVNSVGDVVYEQLKQKYQDIHPFVTTNSSKQNIIEDFIYGTNEGQIKLVSEQVSPEMYRELKSFTYDYSPKTRRITYQAAQGAHDDIVMSLCIGFNSLKNKKQAGSYFIY
jgi:hypothetical protein